MRKITGVTAAILIITLLYGCARGEIKASSDAVSSSTQQTNNKPQNIPEVTSKATTSVVENKPVTAEKNNATTRYYVAKPVNVLEDDWLTNFAGGRNNTIKVSIGEVIQSNSSKTTEAYIELEGKGNKITLIASGIRNEFRDGTTQIKRKVMDFLTGKRLSGNEVVKDYSDADGKQQIILIIDYNENGDGTPSIVFCPQKEGGNYPKGNYYKLEANGNMQK